MTCQLHRVEDHFVNPRTIPLHESNLIECHWWSLENWQWSIKLISSKERLIYPWWIHTTKLYLVCYSRHTGIAEHKEDHHSYRCKFFTVPITIHMVILQFLQHLVNYTLFFYKNVVFPTQAEYSYFSADFRLKLFLYYS